ncbi:hypothetical protein [Streptomyces sp. NPDC058964]|uniref:hypothetical protein n=1 Tax=Streptomyces sp. NPDC058964 TaxID=3346681 RepID=UPI0036C16926
MSAAKSTDDLDLSERRDGRPFDSDDEDIAAALAGAAGSAIENARLFDEQVHDNADTSNAS